MITARASYAHSYVHVDSSTLSLAHYPAMIVPVRIHTRRHTFHIN